MTAKPVLWVHDMRKNGTACVKIYYHSAKGKGYVRTSVYVNPSDWDSEKEVVRKSNPFSAQYNAILQKACLDTMSKMIEGSDVKPAKNRRETSLLKYIDNYVAEVNRGLHEIAASTCKNYTSCLRKLRAYAKDQGHNDLSFDQIDMQFYQSFTNFLQQQGCNQPGVSKHIKQVKKFMNLAAEMGLHDNDAFRSKAFKVYKKSIGTQIYLTESEIEKMEKMDLRNSPELDAERDRFLISYYTVMRWSDSIRFSPSWIFEVNGQKMVRYTSQKESVETILPLNQKAERLLVKHNYSLGRVTNIESNRKLKIIGAMAGLVEMVPDGKNQAPKCSKLATHTARRSAATNMYLRNVNLKVIAELGGWTTTDSLKHYLKASGLETAIMAKDLDFFK